MKPFSFTNRRVTISSHILYSFLVHAILLTYLLSLPIYKGSIDLKSYEGFFVYLRNEEGKNAGKPSSVVKKSKAGAQGARDAKTVIKTKEADEKESIEHFEEKNAAAKEVESGLKMEEPAEEEIARTVEVKEPSEPEKALKEEAPAVKERVIEGAKKQVHETEELLSKEVTVKGATPPAEKTEEILKPQMEGNVFDTASLLKEKGVLERVPSGIEEATKKTASPVLPETDTEGFKEETMHIEDKVSSVAEVLTSEKNRTPSQEDYFLKQDEEKRQAMAEIKPEVKERTMAEEKMPPSGIPVSDVLLLRDITVEVFLKRPSFLYSGSHAKKVPATDTKKLKPLPKATEITNISFEESADIVKVRIKGNGSMTSNVFSLFNNRIVIDIPDVMMNSPLPSVVVSPLKGIRSGKHTDKIRLVLDLKEMMNFDVSSFGDSVVVALKRLEKEPPLSPEAQKPEWKIEAAERKAKMSNVLLQLFRKAHPMVNRKDDSEKKVGVVEEKEETHIAGTFGIKRVSLAKAEKGIYTVTIGNKGEESCEADIVFRLFEGKEGERVKEFKNVELSPNVVLKFKFILPEAIFWDDEQYFTGTIESSNTLTKFSEKTGLIWKEEKDY
jgi:hypothetical protein